MRLRRFVCLKLIPQRAQFFALVIRQQGIDPVCRFHFPFALALAQFIVIAVCVARVDLHNIVDQDHGYGLKHINLFVGVFAQQYCHKRHVPGMFGIVFKPLAAGDQRAAFDFLFRVRLQNKIKLLFQPFRCFVCHVLPFFISVHIVC